MAENTEQVSERKELVRRMGIYLNADMWRFVATIPEAERQYYFDGRNSDMFIADFGRFLLSQVRELASND